MPSDAIRRISQITGIRAHVPCPEKSVFTSVWKSLKLPCRKKEQLLCFSTFHFPSLEVETLFVPVRQIVGPSPELWGIEGSLRIPLFHGGRIHMFTQSIQVKQPTARVCSYGRPAGMSAVPGEVQPPGDVSSVSQPWSLWPGCVYLGH